MMNPHTEHDPLVTLANVPRWVSWRIEVRDGEKTKIPYCAYGRAKSNDPNTWMLRSEAEANARSKGHDGIGIQLGPLDADEYLIGLDLDSCRDPETGEIKEWARLAVQTIGSYTEISPSNTGLKIFALASAEVIGAIRANLTPGGAVTWKGGSGKHPPCIDLYTAGRYFTVTGLHFEGTPCRPRHVTEAQLRTLIDEIGPMLTGKKDRRNADETKADHSEQRSSQTAWDALVAWAASGNSRDHIKALQLIAGGVHSGQNDQSRSACEFAFAAVCKAAGLTEAQYVEAITEWAARGFGYGRADSRSIHAQQRDWSRCWANGKTVQEWPDPEPLDIDEGAPGEFPLDALPLLMREAVVDIQAFTNTPFSLSAVSILAAANFAVQDHFDVEFAGRRYRPLSLNFITVAVSGERKSSVDYYALLAARELVEKRRAAWIDRQNEIAEIEGRNKEKKRGQQKEEVPLSLPDPNIIVGSGTVQGIFRSFHEGASSLALFSDEGGEFLGGYSMKAENRLAALASLSKLWDGGTQVHKLRGTEKTSESVESRNSRLAVHLQGQPIAMQPFLADRMARGQGTLARFLIHKPLSTIGSRTTTIEKWDEDGLTENIRRFGDRVTACLSRPPLFWEDGKTVKRCGLRMTRAAQRVIVDYYNLLECSLKPGATLEGMSDLVNKNHENAARLAATLAAFEGRDGVDEPDMAAGCAIASYFLSETVRLARLAPQEEGLTDALAIARWLKARGGRETNTNLNNGLPTHLRPKKAREKPVRLLGEAGWVRKDGNSWLLNPKIPANWLSAAKADEPA